MADYPAPLAVPPLKAPHKQTFIILHGRGSEGGKFGPPLLDAPIPAADSQSSTAAASSSLAAAFPHARFVFPTAARRRATLYRRAYTHQWFDNWKLDPPATDREELQIAGLRETAQYVHRLLRDEIAIVPGGAASVVLGGLSQGCASSLVSLLLWEGERLAAGFGMCGWLPFCGRLGDQVLSERSKGGSVQAGQGDDDDDEDFDPFERDGEDSDADWHVSARIANWLSEELQVPMAESSPDGTRIVGMPLFLGHGVEDDRVSVVLGRSAFTCLESIGADVSWHEYQGLGHWYSGSMLRDLASYIKTKTNWEE